MVGLLNSPKLLSFLFVQSPQMSLVYIAFNLAVKPDVTPTTPPWKTMEMCPRCVSYPTSDPLAAKSPAEKAEHLQSPRRPDQRLSCP